MYGGNVSECFHNSVGTMNSMVKLLIQSLLVAQCQISPADYWPRDYGPTAIANGLEEFDFVIIGAGSAGCVVASELSVNPKWNILVIEAGGDPPQESQVPSLFHALQRTSYVDNTLIQPNGHSCKASKNGQCSSACGKLIGGTGSINAMLYVRGSRFDYDRWRSVGNVGWGYNNVWPYFQKLERPAGNATHPRGHLILNEFPKFDQDIVQMILKAAKELGQAEVKDFIEPTYTGYCQVRGMLRDGRRESTAKVYLTKVKSRKNLKLIKYGQVTKLNFNMQTRKVSSIELKIQGKHLLKVKASKEVILSSGALGSPKLLMMSGVGPRQVLRPLNISVVQHLSVGENFQDHVMTGIFLGLPARKSNQTDALQSTIYQYLLNKKGPLTGPGVASLLAFINTDPNAKDFQNPDAQFYHGYFGQNDVIGISTFMKAFSISDAFLLYFMDAIEKQDILAIFVMCLHPKTRGTVKLRSTSYADDLLINANYFAEAEDLEVLVRGANYVKRLENTAAFQARNVKILHIPIPECDAYKFKTDQYWRCYIRYCSMSGYHYAGTVKMGPTSDQAACVDPQLKVKGVDNLRVVDASVMPFITSANPNGPTIMIATKAADMITKRWQ